MSKLVDADFKSAGEVGGADRLTDDTKIYVTAKSLNKTLNAAITANDFSSSAGIVSNSVSGNYSMATTAHNTTIRHQAAALSTYQLPAATAGKRFSFVNEAPPTVGGNSARIQPNTGNQIQWGNQLVANPGYLSIDKKGVQVSLLAMDSTTWVVDQISAVDHVKNTTIGNDRNISLVGRDSWVTKQPLPATRYAGSSFRLNGYGYMANGSVSGGNSNDVRQYGDVTNLWTIKATAGSSRSGTSGFSANGYGYSCCGDGSGEVNKYNDSTNTWGSAGSYPNGHGYMTHFSLNGYGYGAYGYNGYNDCNRYNDAIDSWLAMSNSGAGRNYPNSLTLNGYIYTPGGSPSVLENNQYNDSANSWTLRAYIPSTRHASASWELNGYGFVSCGYSEGIGGPLSAVLQYNDALNSWGSKAVTSFARQFASGWALNGNGYACGGYENGSAVEQYN